MPSTSKEIKPNVIKVAGVIIKDGKLLLEKSVHKEIYNIPGGKPLINEKNEQTLIRELEEELGIKVFEAVELLTSMDRLDNDSTKTIKIIYFRVLKFLGELVPHSEVEQLVWIDSQSYKKMKIGNVTKEYLIPYLIKNKLLY